MDHLALCLGSTKKGHGLSPVTRSVAVIRTPSSQPFLDHFRAIQSRRGVNSKFRREPWYGRRSRSEDSSGLLLRTAHQEVLHLVDANYIDSDPKNHRRQLHG
jgi:hypothetical protein